MTAADFRRLALSMPQATASAHRGHADFLVAGKIFANLSLEDEGYGVLFLNEDQQAELVKDTPEVFSPLPEGTGRKGATRVLLSTATSTAVEEALRMAWKKRAEKSSSDRD